MQSPQQGEITFFTSIKDSFRYDVGSERLPAEAAAADALACLLLQKLIVVQLRRAWRQELLSCVRTSQFLKGAACQASKLLKCDDATLLKYRLSFRLISLDNNLLLFSVCSSGV